MGKMNQKSSSMKMERQAMLRELDGEGNERRFELSFSSEEPYERWFGPEILDHSEGAVDLSRLNEIGVVLFNHDRDKVIGKVINAWVENNRGKAIIELDDDEKSEIIYKKVKSGTLKTISVGYIVEVWEEVLVNKKSSDGRFTGPCKIAKKWMPYEISIVSIPADATVGVGRTMEEELINAESKQSLEVYERQLLINKNM